LAVAVTAGDEEGVALGVDVAESLLSQAAARKSPERATRAIGNSIRSLIRPPSYELSPY
jgi:hypothetical protein